jgi:hypothetical protein
MNPLVPENSSTRLDKGLNIDWQSLILSARTIDGEDEFEYLAEIKKYCNNGGIPRGIVGKSFHCRQDADFEKVLSVVHQRGFIQEDLVTYLFTKTDAIQSLKEFYVRPEDLEKQIQSAKFTYLDPFLIEERLSKYLYSYGMYRFFYNHHTPDRARAISRDFCKLLFNADLKNVVCFTTRLPWGKWFDVHSCTDYSFVFINKKERLIWLFCFSHSD